MSIFSAAARAITYGPALFAADDAAALYRGARGDAGLFQERLKFPPDLNRRPDEAPDNGPFMTMQFSQYRRRSIYQQPSYNSVMKIILPVPENLTEQTNVTYDKNTKLGSVAGAVVEGLSGIGSETNNVPFADRAAAVIGGVGVGFAASIGQSVAREIANRLPIPVSSTAINEAVTTARNAASVLTGITTNPFQTVMFTSPEFRSHSFSWKFVPKNPEESRTLQAIIQTFKYHSLPGISAAGGIFFSYPEILEVNFRPYDFYLYKFKPCVVEGISVNYAPNSPSFYKSTKAPTAIQFTIKLQEIEIWTKADFQRNADGIFGTTRISEPVRQFLGLPPPE